MGVKQNYLIAGAYYQISCGMKNQNGCKGYQQMLEGINTQSDKWTNEYRDLYMNAYANNVPYTMCKCFHEKVEDKFPAVTQYRKVVKDGSYDKFVANGLYKQCVKEVNHREHK